MRITKEIFITIKNVIRTIEKTGPYFSKRSRGLKVIGKVHLSLNKFKLLKNSIWINFEIVMLLHCIVFYPGAHNPNFMPQTIRFFCQNHAVITSDCRSSKGRKDCAFRYCIIADNNKRVFSKNFY